MSLASTDFLLWLAGGVLLVVMAGALIRRKLVRELPIFSLYAAFQILRCLLLVAAYRLGHTEYFYSYWGAQTISIVLGFGVVYELYCKLLRNMAPSSSSAESCSPARRLCCWWWRS